MKTKIGVGAVVLVILLAGASYFSPQWTIYQMKVSIQDGDAEKFSEHVDFPALRESFKAQMMALMDRELNTPEKRSNPFSKLGQAMAVGLISPMVDAMVSPAGVIAMMKNGRVKPGKPESTGSDAGTQTKPDDMPKYSISYSGWSKVVVRAATEDSGGFIFKRNGLWSWKLSAVEFPAAARKEQN
jgi:hypothetical protein